MQNPTLDAIIKNRRELELRLEEDTRHLSELWDDVFSVFLRAVCRQIDNELEASTDFLRQETCMLLKSFPKNPGSLRNSTLDVPDNPPHSQSRTRDSLAAGGSDERMIAGKNTSDTRGTCKEEEGSVNPPIGLSDNGWGRKRRRVSLERAAEDTTEFDSEAQPNLRDVILRMQQQLDEQGDKIRSLIEQNQAVSKTHHLCRGLSYISQYAVGTGCKYSI